MGNQHKDALLEMERAMNRLSTCPFCGGFVSIHSMSDPDTGEHWFYIATAPKSQKHCECLVFMESEKFSDGVSEKEIKAIRSARAAKWNRRA